MSVWQDIGMVEGKFRGVNPCHFFDTLSEFFSKLHSAALNIEKEFHTAGSTAHTYYLHEGFNVEGERKFALSEGARDYFNTFGTYAPFVDISPIKPDDFFAPHPPWGYCVKEAYYFPWFDLPLTPLPSSGVTMNYFLTWGEEKYRMAQLLRYALVPVLLYINDTCYVEHSTSRGYVVLPDRYERFYIELPEYWKKDGASAKLAVKINGRRQWADSSIDLLAGGGGETVYFYGAVDLSTHPDFAEYFDDDFVFPSIDCGGGESSSSGGGSSGGSSSGGSSSGGGSSGGGSSGGSSSGGSSSGGSSSGGGSSGGSSSGGSSSGGSSSGGSSSGGGSSGGSSGGGGGCKLEEAKFSVIAKRKTVGGIFSYTYTIQDEDAVDPLIEYWALSWHGYKGDQYFEPIPADAYFNFCQAGAPEGVSLEVIRQGMQEAADEIYNANLNAPWKNGGLDLDGRIWGPNDSQGMFTIKGKGSYTIPYWAFTGNELYYNTSNPAQCFGEIKLESATEGVTSVTVRIGGVVEYELAIGETLDWTALEPFYPFGPLPKPVVGSCAWEPEEVPEDRTEWPEIFNASDDTYPWGNVGERFDLKIEIVGYSCEKVKSVAPVVATNVNAYNNALPEDLR